MLIELPEWLLQGSVSINFEVKGPDEVACRLGELQVELNLLLSLARFLSECWSMQFSKRPMSVIVSSVRAL